MANDDFGEDEIKHYDVSKSDGEKIKGSLEKIKYQTSRHLCINTGLSIGTIIEWLDSNSLDVYDEQVGGFWVYYLKANKPKGKKLYFGGKDGRTVCLRDNDERGNTGKQSVGEKVVLNLPKPPPGEKRLYLKNLPPIDEEELERLAEINPDKFFIADELDVNRNRLCLELINQENLKRAFERGKEKYMQQQKSESKIENKSENKNTAANASNKSADIRERLTVEVLEKAAADGISTAKLARQIGIEDKNGGKWIDALLYNKKYPELRSAWQRGKLRRAGGDDSANANLGVVAGREKPTAKLPIQLPEPLPELPRGFIAHERTDENFEELPEIEVDPCLQHTLNHLSENGHRRAKLEEVKNKLMPAGKQFFGDLEFLGRIAPRRPADLQIGFEGDFFSLTGKQRMLLCEMANLNDEFQKENQ